MTFTRHENDWTMILHKLTLNWISQMCRRVVACAHHTRFNHPLEWRCHYKQILFATNALFLPEFSFLSSIFGMNWSFGYRKNWTITEKHLLLVHWATHSMTIICIFQPKKINHLFPFGLIERNRIDAASSTARPTSFDSLHRNEEIH